LATEVAEEVAADAAEVVTDAEGVALSEAADNEEEATVEAEAETEAAADSEDSDAAEPVVALEAGAEAEAEVFASTTQQHYPAYPGHALGRRDDVSGGFGSRKFYAPKAKGCYITLNNCPRFPHMPTNRPFADGWSHRNLANGWFGPRSAEKRCLERAADYFWWCHGTQGTSVTATWRSTGRVRAAPDVGCWINQFSCAKHPEYRGVFYDKFDGARSSMNQARCFQRAREYHKWCGNPKSITTTAEYRPTGNVQDFPNNKGCFMHGVTCPQHPAGTGPPSQDTVGYFRDHWGELNAGTGDSEKACFARAQQYHAWCGSALDEPFTAEFKPTGRTKTYPRNLMAPISFVEVESHAGATCRVPNANTLIVNAPSSEGACQVPFSALRVPGSKSLTSQIISFDVQFLRRPTDTVGRHGGFYFGANPTGRRDNIVVDWIDRSFDHGYRVYGGENPKWSQLTPSSGEPHQHWTVIVMADGTMHFRSGDIAYDHKISQHNMDKPSLGFWAWPGNRLKITNFNIRPYSPTYKFANLLAEGKVKGNAQVSAITNGVEIRSLGAEGAISVPMSYFGLPKIHSLANKRIAFDVEFTAGSGSAGHHGGIFFGPGAAGRYAGNSAIDWIEVGQARGYRVYWQMTNEKWDYWSPKSKAADGHWEVAIDRNFRVQFTAGDTNWMSRLNAAWNDGYIGFWVYHGVTMRIQNVIVTDLQHDVCSSRPCQNGGACTADGADFTCRCATGFSGADCSIAVDRCTQAAIDSCNGGKCINGPKRYKCDCTGTGFTGKRCDGHKLTGWFRADDKAQVLVDDEEIIATSNGRAEVVELNSAAKPGSVVTVKGLNSNGKGMITAWLRFRGVDIVTDAAWECSNNQGATWTKANVLGGQGMEGWGTTANMPSNAMYIWGGDATTKSGWCRVTLPARAFKTGDRVKLALQTTISAFCARAAPASTTYYYGTVCGNGGVRWSHYYTAFADVRDELKGQMDQCARAREGASEGAIAKYFGDCDKIPTILSDNSLVSTTQAATIKGLRLEHNPCNASPCGRKSTCEWALTGPFPFKCTCEDGYSGTGAPWSPCQSMDACANTNPCSRNARCHKTGAGQFSCRCKPGFAGDGKTCTEVNPCTSGNSPCSPHASCKHTGPGKALCSCKLGFSGDGKVCSEVDSCEANPCKGQGAKCQKTGPGTHVCSCAAGLVLEGDTCHPASVCRPSPCSKDGVCTILSNGKPQCECKRGFKGDGKLCSAINPCEEAGGASLCGKDAICTSPAPGKHACKCAKGFKGDGKVCAPIDACKDLSPCSKNALCKSTGPGAYSCTCNAGYSGNGHHCKVADVCDSKPCSPYATCETVGPNRHTCTCKPGYSGDGTSCAPIDACKTSPCHAQATCRMTGPGTKVCTCNTGFTGTGLHCEPVNACASNPCINSDCASAGPGKYKCTCKPNYTNKGSNNPDVCVERNNCNADVSPCNEQSICKVTGPAQHKCVCKWGYRGKDGEACTEIDRCAEDKPCSKDAACQKTGPGTFLCTCNKNYVGDGLTCKEVNNCKKAVFPCHKDANCKKTGPGTHTCACKPGYDGDGKVACVAHDNCVSNPCPTNSVCEVTGPGQSKCTPRPGYAFTSDKKACVEIDNCKANKSPCSPLASCEKTGPGLHKCTCKPGYAGDGVDCKPVDMCLTGPCDARAKCKKTGPGTFKCVCKTGHTGDGTKGHCDEINLCSSKNPCHAHASCSKTGPGTAACECNKGYFGNGMKCEEVDNCKAKKSPCSINAVCTKTGPATHKCECKPGYKGDGLMCRYDTTEIDHHDNNQRNSFDRIEKVLPKAQRAIFDGHDRIQDAQVGEIHNALSRTSDNVDKLAATAARTGETIKNIAKAMNAVRDNTVEEHIIHTGPVPHASGVTDPATALPKIGDIADKRPKDAGVSRIAARN